MGGGPNQSPKPVYLDDTGQPVPDCLDPNTPAGELCDQYGATGYILYGVFPWGNPSARRFILHSRLTFAGDYYSKFAHPNCGATNWVEMSKADYLLLPSLVVGHE